jgi:predicted ATPase
MPDEHSVTEAIPGTAGDASKELPSPECPRGAGECLGRYRIVRALGAGGMGEVYVADDPRLGRQVAIKVVRASAGLAPTALARFEQEARAASALNHPNIVTIHDIGDEGGQPFIVMELLEGRTLRELARQPLAQDELLGLATQVADALSVTHDGGIVHRDLKPENVFVTSEGVVKLLDFGMACISSSAREDELPLGERLTLAGSILGTVGYMAPEVILGAPADFRSDLFAFGCILYEMAAGARPFAGENAMAILAATLHEEPPPLVKARPDVAPALAALIETALRKDPKQRQASTRDVLDQLRELAAAVPVEPKPTPAPRPLPHVEFTLHGREQELEAIKALLVEEGARLVTLTGPGGSGKTRLAIAVAERLLSWYGGRVFFVPLAAVTDHELVSAAIAQTVGGLEPAPSPLAATIAGLQATEARTLLVVDNFEQVIEAGTELAALIAACPSLAILVTSREILHLYAERIVHVPPLPVPEPEQGLSNEQSMSSPAVKLFIEHARAVNPAIEIDSEGVAAIAQICRRLDGLPLAIELAAARTRLMAPKAMLARLDSKLKLLTGGARDLPDRQQTLRRTLDWSHELLSPGEQALFRRLAVFAGGFTLEQVEAAADPFGHLELDIVDGIGSLVDKSLVVRQGEEESEPRFSMLGVVREYAMERLAASGEEESTRKAHAAYFLVLAEEGGQSLAREESSGWLARLAREHDNLRAALEWTAANGHAGWGLRIAVGIFPFWERTEHLSEGRRRLDLLLSLADSSSGARLRAQALFANAVLACTQKDNEVAAQMAEQALELYRRLGDTGGIAVTCNALGLIYTDLGELGQAASFLQESIAQWEASGDRASYARTLNNLAKVRELKGDYESARRTYADTEVLFRELEDRASAAWALSHQGDVARELQQLEEASSLYTAALAVFRELGNSWGLASALMDLGNLARRQGCLDDAMAHYRESLGEFARLSHTRGTARVLEAMALLAVDQDQHERGLTLAGAASRLREIVGLPLPERELAELSQGLERARERLELRGARQPYQCGRCMGLGEAIAYALSREA